MCIFYPSYGIAILSIGSINRTLCSRVQFDPLIFCMISDALKLIESFAPEMGGGAIVEAYTLC